MDSYPFKHLSNHKTPTSFNPDPEADTYLLETNHDQSDTYLLNLDPGRMDYYLVTQPWQPGLLPRMTMNQKWTPTSLMCAMIMGTPTSHNPEKTDSYH